MSGNFLLYTHPNRFIMLIDVNEQTIYRHMQRMQLRSSPNKNNIDLSGKSFIRLYYLFASNEIQIDPNSIANRLAIIYTCRIQNISIDWMLPPTHARLRNLSHFSSSFYLFPPVINISSIALDVFRILTVRLPFISITNSQNTYAINLSPLAIYLPNNIYCQTTNMCVRLYLCVGFILILISRMCEHNIISNKQICFSSFIFFNNSQTDVETNI